MRGFQLPNFVILSKAKDLLFACAATDVDIVSTTAGCPFKLRLGGVVLGCRVMDGSTNEVTATPLSFRHYALREKGPVEIESQ